MAGKYGSKILGGWLKNQIINKSEDRKESNVEVEETASGLNNGSNIDICIFKDLLEVFNI
jgi:hypothetical protein